MHHIQIKFENKNTVQGGAYTVTEVLGMLTQAGISPLATKGKKGYNDPAVRSDPLCRWSDTCAGVREVPALLHCRYFYFLFGLYHIRHLISIDKTYKYFVKYAEMQRGKCNT